MTIEKTKIEGVYIINNWNVIDDRGLFVKIFNKKQFQESGINFEIKESYYSISKKDVIRGMHFQLPPHDHEKLVYVASGEVIDVVIDLRKNSSTYKEHISVKLSSENKKSIFIPKGLAHGFKSLKNGTITVYNVATGYKNISDGGISYDSFGFDWGVINPIISQRDCSFNTLKEFNETNPF
tara:strand:+ start:51 stop:593 length:543 start_codon:yes stop_codon:yes gene_type:complete